ncbi:hypothetical protein KSS87_004749, partial [Heliosperma pusillum]
MKAKDDSRTLRCNFMPISVSRSGSVQLNFIQCIPMSLSVYQDQIRCVSSPSSALETLAGLVNWALISLLLCNLYF